MRPKFFFLLAFFTFALSSFSFSQSWQWATFGEENSNLDFQGDKIVVDDLGNSYVLGHFNGLAEIGGYQLGPVSGGNGAFVMKVSDQGNVLWVEELQSPQNISTNGIDLDHQGNLYAMGVFRDTLTYGGLVKLKSPRNAFDIFVLKMDTSGNGIWLESAVSTNTAYPSDIACDPWGIPYVYGTFRDSLLYPGVTLAGMTNVVHPFLLKINPNGTGRWGMKDNTVFPGVFSYSSEIAFHPVDGSVHLTGRYHGPMTLGGISLPVFGDLECFVAKYDSAGNYLWARGYGGPHTTQLGINIGETGNTVTVDSSGNVYCGGSFYKSATFGSYNLQATQYPPLPGTNFYVTKHNASGSLLWVKQGHSTVSDQIFTIRMGPGEDIYAYGVYKGEGIFGTDTLPNPNSYFENMFVTRMDTGGNHVWTRHAGGYHLRYAQMDALPSGAVYVTGGTSDSTYFGSIFHTDTSASGEYAFVAKLLDDCPGGAAAPLIVDGSAQFCEGDSVRLVAPSGGNPIWSTGETTNTIWVRQSGDYSVQIEDSLGCRFTSPIVRITVDTLPVPLLQTPQGTTFCDGDSVSIVASGGSSYFWNTGQMSSTIWVSTAGSWTVTVGDSSGCSVDAAPVTTTVNPVPVPGILTPQGTDFCAGDSVSLEATGGGSYLWNNGTTGSTIWVQNSGNFEVTVTNQFNCSATSQLVAVNENPLPQPVISRSGQLLETGAFTIYQWFKDGQMMPGADSASIFVQESGCFAVEVTDSNGCSNLSDTVCVTLAGLETGLSANWRIYPNPNRGDFRVEAPGSGALHWSVFDLNGRELLSGDSQKRKMEVNLPELPAGTYWLNLWGETSQRSFKVLIE